MANDVFINIKDLPEVTQLNSGDYILIETSTGTHILDFVNLIIPRPNTVITTTVDQNTTALLSLSDSYSSSVTTLSSSIQTNSADIITLSGLTIAATENVALLSATISKGVYVGTTQITIENGNRSASNVLSPLPTIDLNATDVIITPANAYATKSMAYVTSILNGNVTIQGYFYNLETTVNRLSVASPVDEVDISASGDAIYNIMVVKSF